MATLIGQGSAVATCPRHFMARARVSCDSGGRCLSGGDLIQPLGVNVWAGPSPRSAAVLASVQTLRAGHDSVHFDLDEHVRVDEGANRNERRHRANVSKDLAMDLGDLLPG